MNFTQRLFHKFSVQSKVGEGTIFEFLLTFARFENALILNGFRSTSNHHIVMANWDSFFSAISENHTSTEDDQELNDAIRFFLNAPPRLLKERTGELIWEQRIFEDGTPDIEKLGFAVKTVRNNLFHGGKFNQTMEEDATRNFMLLEYGMVLLNYWLTLNDGVKDSFLRDFIIS